MASGCNPGQRERSASLDAIPEAQRRWREAARSLCELTGVQGSPNDHFANVSLVGLRILIGYIIALAVLPFVDGRDLLDPPQPVGVLEIDDRLVRPMKVISHEGYLLVQRLQGVAYNPPAAFSSTLNACEHCGHTAGRSALPSRLTRL